MAFDRLSARDGRDLLRLHRDRLRARAAMSPRSAPRSSGKKTAVVEQDKVGGRCLNYACIPAKAVLRSADLLTEIREAEEYGLKVASVEVDYAAVQARREKVVSTLTGGVARAVQEKQDRPDRGLRRADRRRGCARRRAQTIAAETVILATGSVPRAIPGVEFGGRVIGTEQAWALRGAARASGGRRRGGVRRGDRLGLRPPGQRGAAAGGARAPAAERGRRHLATRRAGSEAPGDRRAHRHPRRRRQGRRDERDLLLRQARPPRSTTS